MSVSFGRSLLNSISLANRGTMHLRLHDLVDLFHLQVVKFYLSDRVVL